MIDIIPKKTPKLSKRLSILLYSLIFLLILFIASYFVLNNFLQKAEGELKSLELEIDETMTLEKVVLEKEILSIRDKLDGFSRLLGQRTKTSKAFEVVERVAHPRVWFTAFHIDPVQKILRLSGQTRSFENLGQQIFILEDEGTIENVVLETVSIDEEGQVIFDLSLFFKPGIF